MRSLKFFILFGLMVLISTAARAEEPFLMQLNYLAKSATLEIVLNRLSHDEVRDFMQKLVVQKGDVVIEENMIEQNHLNEMTKEVPLKAAAGDEIVVKLYYGIDNKIYEQSLVVAAEDLPVKELQQVNNEVKKHSDVDITPEKVPEFGYSPEKTEDYGYQKEDSASSEDKYGYSLEENESYKSTVIGFDPDDPENRKAYGYQDPGNEDVGQKGFGYSDYGYKGGDKQFGRESYETPLLWNKRDKE